MVRHSKKVVTATNFQGPSPKRIWHSGGRQRFAEKRARTDVPKSKWEGPAACTDPRRSHSIPVQKKPRAAQRPKAPFEIPQSDRRFVGRRSPPLLFPSFLARPLLPTCWRYKSLILKSTLLWPVGGGRRTVGGGGMAVTASQSVRPSIHPGGARSGTVVGLSVSLSLPVVALRRQDLVA